jgi:hypothetical protein
MFLHKGVRGGQRGEGQRTQLEEVNHMSQDHSQNPAMHQVKFKKSLDAQVQAPCSVRPGPENSTTIHKVHTQVIKRVLVSGRAELV